MRNKKYQKGAGILLILGVIFVIVVVAAIVLRLALGRGGEPSNGENGGNEEPQPQYEITVGNIKFIFKEAINEGKVLEKEDGVFPSWQDPADFETTEKFIKLTIGAQNVGKENIEGQYWEVMEIIDEDGRIFEALTDYDVKAWVPVENGCNTLLKPGFTPTDCVKIYEVANVSTQLKVKVVSKEGKNEGEGLVDLFVVPEGDL